MPKNPEGVSSVAEIAEFQKIRLWEKMEYIYRISIEIIADNIHKYIGQLNKEDTIRLLKVSLIKLWISQYTPLMTESSFAIGQNGFSREQLDIMYGPDFIDAWIKFTLSLEPYEFTPDEMKSIGIIALFNPIPGLIDPEGCPVEVNLVPPALLHHKLSTFSRPPLLRFIAQHTKR
ncbi:ecdysone-induced protein 78C-like [Aphidius gifuensis]|uniref:ecdysone-induced protein 78C-like n=1 Tax=Aphidius gifuensis TaxID=684658 RepID=UPI001CDD2102|nr:ecdysone-induced protein 78C-like [Aphidius gifuensis]